MTQYKPTEYLQALRAASYAAYSTDWNRKPIFQELARELDNAIDAVETRLWVAERDAERAAMLGNDKLAMALLVEAGLESDQVRRDAVEDAVQVLLNARSSVRTCSPEWWTLNNAAVALQNSLEVA